MNLKPTYHGAKWGMAVLINGRKLLQVVGVAWLDSQALAVLSEQGPHTHLHLYDASGAPHLCTTSLAINSRIIWAHFQLNRCV